MANRSSTRQDRARAVLAGLTGLVTDYPDESLALWAMIQELRLITGLAVEEAGSAAAEPAQ